MGHNADGLLTDPPDQLRAFIRDGRITAVPAKRTRRLLLLDQVAQAFEPGRKYSEAAVDEVLKAIFYDHCALRRYLVDEAFMSRNAACVYWARRRHRRLARRSTPRDIRQCSADPVPII